MTPASGKATHAGHCFDVVSIHMKNGSLRMGWVCGRRGESERRAHVGEQERFLSLHGEEGIEEERRGDQRGVKGWLVGRMMKRYRGVAKSIC